MSHPVRQFFTWVLGAALITGVLVADPAAAASPDGQLTFAIHVTLNGVGARVAASEGWASSSATPTHHRTRT